MSIDFPLNGPWKAGWAIALHTLKSVPKGDDQYDTTYTAIGEALNRLKYHGDNSRVRYLAEHAAEFMTTELLVTPYIDVIIPAPPSHDRQTQPVFEIVRQLGKILNKPVDCNYLNKEKDTGELKNIDDPEKRSELLANAFSVTDQRYSGKKVLLFDDLYRSGATLSAVTEVLYEPGKVQNVYVLTLTKTRTRR